MELQQQGFNPHEPHSQTQGGTKLKMHIHLLLMILAMLAFLAAALHIEPQRVSLVPLGLFLWVVAVVLGGR